MKNKTIQNTNTNTYTDLDESEFLKLIPFELTNAQKKVVSQIKIKGETLKLRKTIPVKSGYTFAGWTLAADSSEYVTSIGTEVVGDVTLYAQWAEKESSMPKVIKVNVSEAPG